MIAKNIIMKEPWISKAYIGKDSEARLQDAVSQYMMAYLQDDREKMLVEKTRIYQFKYLLDTYYEASSYEPLQLKALTYVKSCGYEVDYTADKHFKKILDEI